VIIELARLPEDDLPLVAEFVERLKQTRRSKMPNLAVAHIRAEARRRAAQLGDVPRQELAARFIKIIDEIRAEAVAKGVAISGEWRGD
jgi:hypothetical protein